MRIATGLLVLSLLPSVRLSGQSLATFATSRRLAGEDSLAVRVEFGAGRFRLKPATGNVLYRARLEYDEARFQPRFRYDGAGRTLVVGVGSLRRDGRGSVRMGGRRGEHEAQQLSVELSPRVVTDLSLMLGAVQSDVDLGGLSLSRVSLKGGASETTIRFSQPNRAACRELEVLVGAGQFTLTGIGNGRCRRVTFRGGVGDMRIDLTGDWGGLASAEVDIKMALGDLELTLPEGVGAEIHLDKVLASFESVGPLQRVGDGSNWRTLNWDGATTKLNIDIGAAFGSIRVRFAGNGPN